MTPSNKLDRTLPHDPAVQGGHPAFILSPNETPLQTPSHSPPLRAQNLNDSSNDLNSLHLIDKLQEQQEKQRQKEIADDDNSIAINGTTLPPIRSVFSFGGAKSPDVAHVRPVHVERGL